MAALPHLGIGFATKRWAPNVPTIILLLAPLLLDLLAMVFDFLHIEKPDQVVWTHSLFMAVIWSILFGLFILLFYRDWKICLVVCLLIFSHWIVDFITWPMTAVFPRATGVPIFMDNSRLVGLGLYKTLGAVIFTETMVPLLGVMLFIRYQKTNKARP